jgi:hypothetical protein
MKITDFDLAFDVILKTVLSYNMDSYVADVW